MLSQQKPKSYIITTIQTTPSDADVIACMLIQPRSLTSIENNFW